MQFSVVKIFTEVNPWSVKVKDYRPLRNYCTMIHSGDTARSPSSASRGNGRKRASPRRVCENRSGRGLALKHFRPPSEDKGSARMLPASLTAIKGKGAPRGIGAHRGGTVFFRSEDYAVGTRFGRPVPRTWNRVPPPPREYSSPTIVIGDPFCFVLGAAGNGAR